jgi:hypothetical protein
LSNCAFLGRLLFLQKTSCRWQGHLHVQVGAPSSFLAQASFFAHAEVALLEEEEMVMEGSIELLCCSVCLLCAEAIRRFVAQIVEHSKSYWMSPTTTVQLQL